MSSPFVQVDSAGRIIGDFEGKFTSRMAEYLDAIRGHSLTGESGAVQNEIADEPDFGGITVGGSVSGVIDANGDVDYYTVNLVAGQTYTISLRGTGTTPINDSLLTFFGPAGTLVAYDDDGGNALYSMLTFTVTEPGTYYIGAQTFDNATPDIGGYTIDVRQQGVDNVGSTNATAGTLNFGTTFNFIETSGDVDRYAVTLEAGQFYTFSLAGGADYETDYLNVPAGELDTIITLRSATGTILATNDDNNFPSDISSGLGFFAQTSGTYYIDARAYPGQTGGYALEMGQIDLSAYDPLESLNWDSANNIPTVLVDDVPTAYVYFAPAGENFGETGLDGNPMVTHGWNQKEMDAVMLALEQYTPITGINYVITTDVDQATFRLLTVANVAGTPGNYGAYFYPQAEASYGSQMGIGVFNVNSGGWDKPGVSSQNLPGDQVSLDQGGFAFGVILHEFGHAHGIAHPHDRGGGSEVMLGVTGATGSFGVFDLNQGVYTVMSYNDAWQRHPDGASAFTISGIDNGWSGTLGAFDIAVLQARYGVHENNEGNTNYALTDVVDDGFYQTIWDSGGTDTISYGGALNAQIDLTAATLDYTATGGGVISFLHNVPGTPANDEIKGGYTIANGVVIENATGGSGHDVLLGNSANNQLTGNAGDDFLWGRAGDDKVYGGNGADELNGGAGNDQLFGGAGVDIFVFTDAGTDHIKDYQSGEKIDLSGLDVTMDDVTISKQFILVDLDGPNDLRIMFNTKNFDADDLIFADDAAAALSANLFSAGLGGAGGGADYFL